MIEVPPGFEELPRFYWENVRMSRIFMDSAGAIYLAEVPKNPSDCEKPFVAPELMEILTAVPTNTLKQLDIDEVFLDYAAANR